MAVVLSLDEIKRTPYISSSFTPPQYPHSHDFFEISFCISGRSVNIVNNLPVSFQNGTCIILRPTDVHAVTEYRGKQYEHIDLYITKERFAELCNCFHPQLLARILDEKEPLAFSFSGETFSFLFNQCLLLKDMLANKNEFFEPLYFSLISTILAEWVKYSASVHVFKPVWLTELLPKFNDVTFLQKNVTQIAQETGFSLPYFSSQFKKHMGISAIDYLTKKRVDFSKELLSGNPHLRILDISGMLGFENPSTFSKHFLQEFNITPKEYRKQKQKNSK